MDRHSARKGFDNPSLPVEPQQVPVYEEWNERGARRHNLAMYMVKGTLVPLDSDEQHYSMDLGDEVVNEYKLELLCEDDEVDQLVAALHVAARTGQAVAGWITVTDLARVVPIH